MFPFGSNVHQTDQSPFKYRPTGEHCSKSTSIIQHFDEAELHKLNKTQF